MLVFKEHTLNVLIICTLLHLTPGKSVFFLNFINSYNIYTYIYIQSNNKVVLMTLHGKSIIFHRRKTKIKTKFSCTDRQVWASVRACNESASDTHRVVLDAGQMGLANS